MPYTHSYSSSHANPPRVIIDHMGNMHDPDYQYFPTITSSYSSSGCESDEGHEEEYVDPFSRPSSSSRRASGSLSLYPPFASYIAPRETNKLRKSARVSVDSYDSEEYSSTEEEVDLEDAEISRGEMSCSETIKRQLQSMSFNMTFRVFRARRRIRKVFRR